MPWWFRPGLRQSVAYSEILDRHMLITMTERTRRLIEEAAGFDNYILRVGKTRPTFSWDEAPFCLQTHQLDLRSRAGMRLKREMLLALIRKDLRPADPRRRDKIIQKYEKFIIPVDTN